MGAFQDRLWKAKEAEEIVMLFLSGSPNIVSVAKNGTEHTHPDFVAMLRQNIREASKFVRFAPDGVYLNKAQEVIHFEVKASTKIERDAWDVYLKYQESGCRIVLFVYQDNRLYWQWLSAIRFIDSHSVVEEFANPFPVDADGWICPRQENGWHRRVNSNMSGTPYKCIAMESMNMVTTK